MRTLCNKKAIPMLFILSLLLFPAVSFAEYVGSFSRIEGRVDLLRAGATAVVRARQGDGVSNGDIIRTKSDGRAEILFKDDTTVTVAPESRLKIDEYTFNPDNSRNKGILSLLRGKLRAAVSKVKAGLIPVSIGASTFNINTPTTVAGVRGTVLFVFYERGITGVVFKEGSGFVYNQNIPERIVNVSEGQATFILRDDAPPLPPRPATDAEMSQHIIDTTIKDTDTTPTDNGDTAAIQTETTHVDTADIMTALGETAGEDKSAPETISSGVDSSPPPPVLPITETDTETLKDTIPPLITITSSPQAITNSASGSFTITANEPVTFTYSMGSVVVTSTLTTSDTIDLAGLPEGGHTLNISATDGAGNISTTSYTWTTDYTPPASLSLTGTPSSITNVNSATIGASATDANDVTYSYTLDGTASTGTLTSLTEGSHTFVATATDGAGNISTTSYSWLTDYTAPASLALTGTPASITNINNATIGATATDASGVTYSYTLDGASSSGALTGLTEGTHTFVATATDGAGNISTTSYSWTTDYTAPAASITPVSASPITGVDKSTVNIYLSSNEISTYSYSLVGPTSSTGTGASLILSPLTEGLYTLTVMTTDTAGNTSSPASLSFDLSRYSLAGNVGNMSGGISGSVASGEVAGISSQSWGGWINPMTGTYTSMPSSFTLNAGGTSTDTTTSNNGGYWVEIINGTSGASSLSGTSNLKYLSYDRLGSGTGSFTGSYSAGTWSATDTGTYTETPLAWSGRIITGLSTSNVDGISVVGVSLVGGLSGGSQSPWSGTTSLTLMGSYLLVPLSTDIGPFMWSAPIYGYNRNNSTYTTYDGGAFWGLTGGVWKNRTIDASVYSLYIDPSGNAGILRGSLTGGYYPELMMFEADGTWTPTVLATTGLNPALLGSTPSPDISFDYSTSSIGGFAAGGVINGNYAKGLKYSMPSQDWGVWQTLESGAYSGTTSDTWNLSLNPVDVTLGTNPNIIVGTMTDGSKWSNGVLAGQTYGFGADISATPMTWISVGETIGTFDAAALTWQAVQTGAWLGTTKFLTMAGKIGTTPDTGALTALNIPFVEVGRASLTGTNSQWTVINMNNTTFFAYSNGAAPKIWATGDVNGSYNCSACGPTPTLTGNGLSANLNFQTWDTVGNKWIATVNGSGTYAGTGTMNGSTVQFNGAAAGTNSGGIGGTFSGTASGVAQ